MTKTYEPTWDLDDLFSGGSSSVEFQNYLQEVEKELDHLAQLVESFQHEHVRSNMNPFITLLHTLESTQKRLRDAGAFVSCLSAQNVHDKQATQLTGEMAIYSAKMNAIQTHFDQKLLEMDEDSWQYILNHPEISELAFVLQEKRNRAKEKLSAEEELLINDLSVDGYNGWGQMYNTIVAGMSVDIHEDGQVTSYSVGQAANKLSHPDRAVRKHVFEQLGKAWQEKEDLFGQTLNHLAGFRLEKYKHRGWDDVLKEPLDINRMTKETLNAMWGAISDNKRSFVTFLEKKAELLGLDRLSMYDVNAPLTQSVKTSTYTEGAEFIIDHFRSFSPKMADFAQMAFERRWIEAEDRAGKRPGGFCTSFPNREQTRVFMTYSGTSSNIATLAHELGHAYHQHVMNDVNGLNQRYAMNVAETASTFAEMIVADASVDNAETDEEKRGLLADKIQRSIAFFMNIHARFLFETRFYDERKSGPVSVKRLNELMVEAQEEAYAGAIEDYDPHFWSSKLHFHITGVPFYNFPYTFGYLFSLGIYAHAKQKGGDFEDDYIALLRDTGSMTVEELAMKHLNVDLRKPAFWENAIKLCVDDVNEFLAL